MCKDDDSLHQILDLKRQNNDHKNQSSVVHCIRYTRVYCLVRCENIFHTLGISGRIVFKFRYLSFGFYSLFNAFVYQISKIYFYVIFENKGLPILPSLQLFNLFGGFSEHEWLSLIRIVASLSLIETCP